jgi:hypothetical protein
MGFWRDINTPSAFERDWYGELTNQAGHTLLGMVSTILFLCAWREINGEMPYRTWAFASCFLFYVLGIEVAVQRWLPGDSWFDSMMFGFGAAGALLPYEEVGVVGNTTTVTFDHRYMAGIILAWSVILGARVKKRYDAK